MEQGDELIRRLAATADKFGLSIRVVLQIKGLIVSGELCSAAEYFALLAQGFQEATADKGAAKVRDGLVDGMREMAEEALRAAKSESHVADFIHLKEVEITGPQDINAPLWRGRIDCIDGLIVGTRQ